MTRPHAAWFGVWAASLVAAFYLGVHERGDEPRPAEPVATRSAQLGVAPRCTVDEAAISRAVSAAVAAKVAAKVDGATPATHERAAPATPIDSEEPAFDPETAAQAYRRGSEILDVAIARGSWTRDDAGDMRLVILQLPKEQRRALLDRLFGAVSANQLQNDVAGAPI